MPVKQLIRSPIVLKAAAAIVAAVVALSLPNVLESAISTLVAFTALVVGFIEIYGYNGALGAYELTLQ